MTEILCVCGHAAEPHTHHRDGRDCSRCGREFCREFRPWTWWRRVLHRCGWYPAPLPDPVPAVDFTSLFTPARFAKGGTLPSPVDSDSLPVLLSPGGWLTEPVLSPEQWERIARDLPDESMGSWFVPREAAWRASAEQAWRASAEQVWEATSVTALDADGHPIEIEDWVQILGDTGPYGMIGEVVAVIGPFCEVRVPGSENRAVPRSRVRVIVEEES